MPRCCTCSSSLGPTTLLSGIYRTFTCSPPLPIGEPLRSVLDRFICWTFPPYLPRTRIQRPAGSVSSLLSIMGPTTWDRTWRRREALLAADLSIKSKWGRTYVVYVIDRRRQAPVHAEDAVLDYGRQRKIIKHVGAVPPYIQRPVFPETLVVESIHLRNLSALVVPSNQSYPVGIPNLKCKQQ